MIALSPYRISETLAYEHINLTYYTSLSFYKYYITYSGPRRLLSKLEYLQMAHLQDVQSQDAFTEQ